MASTNQIALDVQGLHIQLRKLLAEAESEADTLGNTIARQLQTHPINVPKSEWRPFFAAPPR